MLGKERISALNNYCSLLLTNVHISLQEVKVKHYEIIQVTNYPLNKSENFNRCRFLFFLLTEGLWYDFSLYSLDVRRILDY